MWRLCATCNISLLIQIKAASPADGPLFCRLTDVRRQEGSDAGHEHQVSFFLKLTANHNSIKSLSNSFLFTLFLKLASRHYFTLKDTETFLIKTEYVTHAPSGHCSLFSYSVHVCDRKKKSFYMLCYICLVSAFPLYYILYGVLHDFPVLQPCR